MIRMLGLSFLFLFSTALMAQDLPGEVGKDMSLVAHATGGLLQGWEVVEGESIVDKDGVQVGGKAQAKLKLTAPVGDRFQLRFDYTYSGAGQPTLHWETDRPYVWALQGSGSKKNEFFLNGNRGSWHSGTSWRYLHRNIEGNSSQGSLPGGTGRLLDMHILIPAGVTLRLQAVDVHSTPVLAPSSNVLVMALVILGLVLASICLVGWLVNRRRTPSASRPTP